jgi:raffinose/stachyose/melibiose transport system permease protein
MDKVMSNKGVIALYVLPSLLLILAIVYIPIVFTGYYGLMNWDGISPMTFVGLNNYNHLLHDADFWNSAKHSLLFALMSTLALVVYLLISLVLAGEVKGANLLRKIYLIPMLLSSVAIAQLWLKIFHPSTGVLNTVLAGIGFKDTPAWLSDPKLVLGSLFVPILWQYAGFYILIYYAALKNIPNSLVEAARTKRARSWRLTCTRRRSARSISDTAARSGSSCSLSVWWLHGSFAG